MSVKRIKQYQQPILLNCEEVHNNIIDLNESLNFPFLSGYPV